MNKRFYILAVWCKQFNCGIKYSWKKWNLQYHWCHIYNQRIVREKHSLKMREESNQNWYIWCDKLDYATRRHCHTRYSGCATATTRSDTKKTRKRLIQAISLTCSRRRTDAFRQNPDVIRSWSYPTTFDKTIVFWHQASH